MVSSMVIEDCKKNYRDFLFAQKVLVETYFPWLNLELKNKTLAARGILDIFGRRYNTEIFYSPFFDYRFDRIFLKDSGIVYDRSIHVYVDLSLCLYHPIVDVPFNKVIPLVDMIPWISEWCIHYQEWKKYKVWLGKEIQH